MKWQSGVSFIAALLARFHRAELPDINAFPMKGMSLIEILLVIAIISVVGAASIPTGSAFLVRNELENKTNEIINVARVAQINSISGKEDSTWGINITSTQIILYKGTSYAARDSDFDEVFTIPSSITITQDEINFAKLTGNADATATITITSNAGDNNTVTINEVGTVDVT